MPHEQVIITQQERRRVLGRGLDELCVLLTDVDDLAPREVDDALLGARVLVLVSGVLAGQRRDRLRAGSA
jgi:hypothetical protein